VTDPATAHRLLTHITTGHLNTLGRIQQKVTGDPDRLTEAAERHAREATRVTEAGRLLAERRESLTTQWSGFASQKVLGDAKALVEKLAVVEKVLLRERYRLNSASKLLRHTRSVVDEIIATFSKQAKEIIGSIGCEELTELTNRLDTAGRTAFRRALEEQKAAGTALGKLFSSADVPPVLPYDAWRVDKEYDSLVNYIHKEMVDNSQSHWVDLIRLHNKSNQWVWANGLWFERVAPGQPWDHKPKIRELYGMSPSRLSEWDGHRDHWSPMPATPDGLPQGMVSYQVWSNIHYGYVGLEAGFSETWLKMGADIADLAMRQKTDPGDAVAIEIGAQLRRDYPPELLRPEHINAAIMARYQDLVRSGKIQSVPERVP
jgi:hypothetical protein